MCLHCVTCLSLQRTGVELKSAWLSALQVRAAGQQLATRAMRDKAAAAGAAGAAAGGSGSGLATVRVRFPEGVCLQVTATPKCTCACGVKNWSSNIIYECQGVQGAQL